MGTSPNGNQDRGRIWGCPAATSDGDGSIGVWSRVGRFSFQWLDGAYADRGNVFCAIEIFINVGCFNVWLAMQVVGTIITKWSAAGLWVCGGHRRGLVETVEPTSVSSRKIRLRNCNDGCSEELRHGREGTTLHFLNRKKERKSMPPFVILFLSLAVGTVTTSRM